MNDTVIMILLITVPFASIVFFITSLVLFIMGRKKEKSEPGSVDREILDRDKVLLIVSSILLVVIVLAFIAFVILLSMAIAYM